MTGDPLSPVTACPRPLRAPIGSRSISYGQALYTGVYQCLCYSSDMSIITIRLNAEDKRILDKLTLELGSKTNAIRQALRMLAADRARRDAFNAFVKVWNSEDGPVDPDGVAALAKRHGL